MRIAQLVVTPVILPEIAESDSLESTDRGCGGFGSTGLN
jgi:dUTP pyrophosphatase